MDELAEIKANAVDDAIRAYIAYLPTVMTKGRIMSEIEFFAQYAHQLRSQEVHNCLRHTMVNGCCTECGACVRPIKFGED